VIRFDVFAPGGLNQDVYVDAYEVIAIGPSWIRDIQNHAAHVRTLRLRGGCTIDVLDSPENWQKLQARCCACAKENGQ
jgi:hypothetical protein